MNDQNVPSSVQQEEFLKELGLAPIFQAHHAISLSKNKHYVSSVKNKQCEDLPDEVMLHVFNFLELPGLIRCGLVSKRFRSVSFIESLWQKIDISSRVCYRNINGKIVVSPSYIVSIDLVKRIINRGCKSLSLRGSIKVKGDLYNSDLSIDSNYRSKNRNSDWIDRIQTATTISKSQLINLELTQCNWSGCDWTRLCYKSLLASCYSLKKLTIKRVSLTRYMFEKLCKQNGRTIQALDLTFMKISLSPLTPEDIQLIVDNCVNIKEVDFTGCRLSENCVEILANNLSPKVEKLGLGGIGTNAKDKHIVALVSKCKKINSLNLAFRDITDISLTSIMKDLKFTLEELDLYGCDNPKLSEMKILEMRSMPKLKTLNHSMHDGYYEKLRNTLPNTDYSQMTNKDPWYLKHTALMQP